MKQILTSLVIIALNLHSSFSKSLGSNLKINEIMPSNAKSFYDDSYKTPDWIELYNIGDTAINLKGFRISDKFDFEKAWIFPDTVIRGKSFISVYASGWDTVVSNKFNIESNGLGVFQHTWFDSFSFLYKEVKGNFVMSVTINSTRYIQGRSVHGGLLVRESLDSFARFVGYYVMNQNDNPFYWLTYRDSTNPYPKYKFPGFSNHNKSCFLKIWRDGEWIYTYATDEKGWIIEENQIWFPVNTPVYVGLAVASNDEKNLTKFSFSDFMLLVDEEKFSWEQLKFIDINTTTPGKIYRSREMHTNFKLDSKGESIYLWDANGNLIDSLRFGEILTDVSYGRYPDGSNTFYYFKQGTIDKPNVNATPYIGITKAPKIKVDYDIFNQKAYATIQANTNEQIFYTLDGSEPTISSMLYQNQPLVFTTTTVLKAKTFRENYLSGKTSVITIFVNDSSTINVVSLSGKNEDFRNKDSSGLLDRVFSDMRIVSYFEFFDKNFNQLYNSAVELKLLGHGAARNPLQPSFKIKAKNSIGDNELNFPFFGEKSQKTYQSIMLRNSSGDWISAYIRDAYCHQLAKMLHSLDISEYIPINVYINGQYFGLYNLREITNDDYLSHKYKLNKDSINIFKLYKEINNGSVYSYYHFIDELHNYDINSIAAKELVKENLDLDNLTDYLILEFYVSNYDWLNWNIKLWQSESYDGRWRFLPHDLDWSLNYNSLASPDYPSIKRFFSSDFYEKYAFTELIKKIIQIDEFKNKFINRSADILNFIFIPEKLTNLLDSLVNSYIKEVSRQKALYPESLQNFETSIEDIKDFLKKRAYYYRNEIVEIFELSGLSNLKITSNLKKPIKIRINSIEVQDTALSGIYFNDVPIEIELLEHPNIPFIGWFSDSLIQSKKITLVLKDSLELKAIFDFKESPQIVINEIMYKASKEFDSEDWIELFNPNDDDVDLSGWLLKDDNDKHIFEIPNGTIIKAKDYLVIVERIKKFSKIHPDVSNYIGEFDFGFGLEDMVRIYDVFGILIDSVKYSSSPPWDPKANETGYSLELINPYLDNTQPQNWRASYVLNGTPGRINSNYSSIEVTMSFEESINIYPNPATTILYINGNCISKLNYVITNSLGKKILFGTINDSKQNKISLNGLPNGLYFISLFEENKIIYKDSFVKISD